MAYKKQTWVDLETPLDAEHMNHIEDGIGSLSEEIANANRGVFVKETSGNMSTTVLTDGEKFEISGKTDEEVTLIHHGKNFIPISAEWSNTIAGVTYTANSDGTMSIVGTASGKNWPTFPNFYIPAGTYRASYLGLQSGIMVHIETGSTGTSAIEVHPWVDYNSKLCRIFTLAEPMEIRVVFSVTGNIPFNTTVSMMIEKVDSKLTSEPIFEAYHGEILDTTLPVVLTAYEGLNIVYTDTADTLIYDVKTTVEEVVKKAMEIDPADYDISVLTLDGDCTGMTKDDYVPLAFTFKGMSGTAEVKKQGTSSIGMGTEIGAGFDDDVGGLYNFTIKFPEAFEVKEGWGEHDKYVAKAYPADASLLRDVFGATLWGQIVATRESLQSMSVSETMKWVWIATTPPISETTFEYTTVTSEQNRVMRTMSSISGGKLHFDFDRNKLTNIHLFVMCYDSNGNPYKVIGRPRDAQTDLPTDEYTKYISGEQDISIWEDVGSATYFYIATDSLTIPIPDGCTVQIYQYVGGPDAWPYTYSPDNSLVFEWSWAAEQDGTWVHRWVRTGITSTVEKDESPLAISPNYGAIDGFPVVIMLNGKFYHLSMFNIPKDGWMAGMGNGTQEAILCAEGTYPGSALKGDAVVGTDFELEYISDESNTGWVQTALNNLVTALNASDGTDLDTTVAQYLDWDSAIDLMAFNMLIGGFDLLLKNYLLYIYDGEKSFMGAYDMDSTFGNWWTGKEILAVDANAVQPDYVVDGNKINQLIRNYKVDEFKTRYAELRAGVMSEGNLDKVLMNLAAKIPAALLAENNKRWPLLRSTNANTIWQMLNWYRLHSQIVDKWVEALT